MKRDRAALRRAETATPPVSRRAFVLFGIQAAFAGALAVRLRQIQIEEGALYHQLAEENRISLRLLAPARGKIFDRNGHPIAVNRQNLRVALIRERAGDPDRVLDQLARIVPIPEAERARIAREFAQKSAFAPVIVAEHLSWEQFALINANAPALPGVTPDVGLSRFYPEAEAFSHIVGHVGRVSEKDVAEAGRPDPVLLLPDFQIGKNGVEKIEEARLRGAAGVQRAEVNAVGRVIREIDRNEGRSGDDLTLTVDRDLQRFAMARMGGESAATVVMDVVTGDLLCLASAPGFDPNKFVFGIGQADWKTYLDDDHRPLANKTVAGQYPPGSTFKMVVALAALEAGVVSPGDAVFCNGGYQLGNRRFHCWKRGGHGTLACREAIKQSCDVYFYDVAKRVGPDAIAAMARRLGLGERHALPITAIAAGLTPTREWKKAVHGEGWQQGDSLNVGIGQGFVLATPLQLAVMTARIAGGRAVSPRLIREDGPAPEAAPLGLRESHLALMRSGMDAVMNEQGGTARSSRIHDPETGFAGKTGTSQVRRITMAERARGVIRNQDLPWNRRDHGLFVGYAPLLAPRYAVAVVVEHGGGGSTAAAPIARDVMMHALYGPEPPLIAYPPAMREEIARQRAPAEPPAAGSGAPLDRA